MPLARREALTGAAGLMFAGLGAAAYAAAPDEAALKRAFLYGFPLYEFARVAQERSQAFAGSAGTLNTVGHRAQLSDHTSRQVTAPNNDTVYSSAFLELSGGPVEVFSPSEAKRYFSIAFMDAFTDNFAYIGTRATKGIGGRFWIVGPQWKGAAPAGVAVLRSSTNDVWMLGRVLVEGPADVAGAQALQRQIRVPTAPGRPAPRPFGVRAVDVADPANFLGVVNDILTRSPGGKGQTARARRFSGAGIGVTGPPGAELLAAWRAYLPKGLQSLREGFEFPERAVDGWSSQPPGVGDFGTNDALRANVALGGLAALGEDEAMYYHASFAPNGERLSGAHRYRWTLPAGGVPADGFWSLTMYQAEADGRFFLVDNPIRRYAIGDRTPGLVRGADGSLEILIQREQPDGPLAANWLPAPAGPMRLALRAYLPRKELRQRRWKVPPLVEVKG